jgi:putative transposase
MCRVLGVSRAGFYAWERRAPCDRELSDAWLTDKIRAIHARSKGTYGSRRIHAELRLEHSIRVGKKRVERLMALAGALGRAATPAQATVPASTSPSPALISRVISANSRGLAPHESPCSPSRELSGGSSPT